jgi:hypothetical protein
MIELNWIIFMYISGLFYKLIFPSKALFLYEKLFHSFYVLLELILVVVVVVVIIIVVLQKYL